jgi:hypothetical protein
MQPSSSGASPPPATGASPVPELKILSAYITLPEPELAFHPQRSEDRSAHPLEGLLRFGPTAAH